MTLLCTRTYFAIPFYIYLVSKFPDNSLGNGFPFFLKKAFYEGDSENETSVKS